MDSSDEELIVTLAIALNVLDNKPRKKTQKKALGEAMVAKNV